MTETMINYGTFMLLITFFIIIVGIVKCSRIPSTVFKFLGKSILFLLQFFMMIVFTIIISILVGLIILIHPFFSQTPHFFANGESVHILSNQDQALMLFAITYGALCIIAFTISSKYLEKHESVQELSVSLE